MPALEIKCPICESENFTVLEWRLTRIVGDGVILPYLETRPRGKCSACKWKGYLPLKGDVK